MLNERFSYFDIMISKQENIYKHFKLPIEYLKEKIPIEKDLNNDLELTTTKDASSRPIYFSLFQPKTQLGKECIHSWNKYFTNDIFFLKLQKNATTIFLSYKTTTSLIPSDLNADSISPNSTRYPLIFT